MPTPIRDYLNRSGKTELGLGWTEENEHGFCVWRREGDALVLSDVYGDGPYWDSWATDKAREIGATKIRFTTKRDPAAFQRKYGYSLTDYTMEKVI
jgi:hypothetical protein